MLDYQSLPLYNHWDIIAILSWYITIMICNGTNVMIVVTTVTTYTAWWLIQNPSEKWSSSVGMIND